MSAWKTRLFGWAMHGGLTCREVGKVLQSYLDEQIDTERAAQIEVHLEECRRCGLDAETYERIKATLAAQRPVIPAESIDRLRVFGERLASGGEPIAP